MDLSTVSFQYSLAWHGFSFKGAGSIRRCPGLGLFQVQGSRSLSAALSVTSHPCPCCLIPPLPWADLSETHRLCQNGGGVRETQLEPSGVGHPGGVSPGASLACLWLVLEVRSYNVPGSLASRVSSHPLHHWDAKKHPFRFPNVFLVWRE